MSEQRTLTRRTFLRRAALVGGAAGGVVVFGVGGKVALDQYSRAKELARRDLARPRDGAHWLTAEERTLLGALAALIVPSDDTGPGAQEAGVVETLDRLVAASPNRQTVYAPGLLAFDALAHDQHDRIFADLAPAHKLGLLEWVDRVHQDWDRVAPPLEKIRRKMAIQYHQWDGLTPAVALFSRLVKDVLQAFYTSQVAWEWLGYDGPPMPRGYLGRGEECSPSGHLGTGS